LLRVLLGNHSQIDAPVSPHFLDTFVPILDQCGDLCQADNRRKLLEAMIRLANHSYHDWKLSIDTSVALEDDSLCGFYELYDYVSKDNHAFKYAFQLSAKLRDAKFLYLYRDPRDHVASWMKRPLFLLTPYDIITKWNREQSMCLSLIESYNLPIFQISYEDILEDSQKVMRAVLDFIGVPIEEDCFETNPTNKEANRNEFWQNLSKPIMKDNSQKWDKYISDTDLELVETLARENMLKLGYGSFETDTNWKPSSWRLFKFQLKVRRWFIGRKYTELREQNMSELMSKIQLVRQLKADLVGKSK
jgi:hypothetical protein